MGDHPLEVPSPNQLIAAAIVKLGCTTHEARLRIDRTTRATSTTVTVECPDRATWYLLGALVESLDGRLVRKRTVLAGGRPAPGIALSFVLPFDPVSPGLPQLD
ncbi:MAG TPA: hypothetical protein VMX12_07545 [Acidimicrobiia bacterium]|nr:hypothetical protein [Acidimicrobiia bacterium]